MTLSFDAYDALDRPRVFAGMFRPPFEECRQELIDGLMRGGGRSGYGVDEPFERWLRGFADKPLYRAEP